MRLSIGSAAILAILVASKIAAADELDEQFDAIIAEKRTHFLSPALNAIGESGPVNIPESAKRLRLAQELAVRRGVDDIASGQWEAAAPHLQIRVGSAASLPMAWAGIQTDRTLSLAAAWRMPGRQNTQMSHAEGAVGSAGQIIPVVAVGSTPWWVLKNGLKPQPPTNVVPMPLAALQSELTDNEFPDIFKLPFRMGFVVELRTNYGHCSGALLSPTLVLTARHCVRDENDVPLDGQSIQVRSVTGGSNAQGVPGPAWMMEADEGRPSEIQYRDIALLTLLQPLMGPAVSYAQVAEATKEDLWVIMSGIGYTSFSAPNQADWNSGYVARQEVEFAQFSSPLPARAAIPWDSTSKVGQASQCAGDSGGPVFVVGRGNIPLILGVLSRTGSGDPNTIERCAAAAEDRGVFINIGHPYVRGPLCDRLSFLGVPCTGAPAYVVRQVTSSSGTAQKKT